MAPIQSIQVPGTKAPVGHYSQGVAHGGLIFVSGQLPTDLATGAVTGGPIETQTEIALGNVKAILEAAGSGLDRVLQMTIFITRMDDWGAVNGVYARVMGAHRPARAIVPVLPLHHAAGIEITCVAAAR